MKSIWITTLLTAGSLAAAPADFAGTWKVKYAGPPMTGPKTIGSMIFAIAIDGDSIGGMAQIGVWPGVAPISNGKVEGGRISFTAKGYLSSTTGTPTCLLEGSVSGGELVIQLKQIESIGGPGSGQVFEYRGGRLDDAGARAAKIEALTFLSRPRRAHPEFPDSNTANPLTPEALANRPVLNAARQEQAHQLANLVEQWENIRNDPSQPLELDRLVAFYNSPQGQSLVATSPHGDAEIQTAVAQFVAAMPTSLAVQGPDNRYDALRNALALSEVQIAQCRQNSAQTAYQVLDDLQRSKLTAIRNRAVRSDAEAALANWLGLNDKVNWGLCACGPCRMKPYASQLGFSDAQMAQLSEFEKAAQPALNARFAETKKRWLELLNSDEGKNSPEANRLSERMNQLLAEMQEPRLPRDAALGLLNGNQKALAADLENALLLIGEAIDLNLLPRHFQTEGGLCH